MEKRKKFRKSISSYKLDENNRLCILNHFNKIDGLNKYYKIPYKHEVNILINENYANFIHCGRESTFNNMIKNNWYWYRIAKEIQNIINNCPFWNNFKKFDELKGKIKIIIENGPHYRYVTDIWHLPKEIVQKTEFKYILDIVGNFS